MGWSAMLPRSRWLRVSLALLAVVGVVYAWTGPYVFPVSWGLGPCFKDYTSPSTYLPRLSPLRTERGLVGEATVQVCYGSPVARGRELFGPGALVPYGEYWRTGANEPTRFFTDAPVDFGGIVVPPGRYSIYTVPREDVWDVVLNRSTFHWGYDFSDEVTAKEVGRIQVVAERSGTFQEHFLVQLSPRGPGSTDLILSWGRAALAVPLQSLDSATR